MMTSINPEPERNIELTQCTLRSLLLILLLTGFSAALCQTSEKSTNFWVSCGPGFIFNKNTAGLSLYGSIDLSITKLKEITDGSKRKNSNWKIRAVSYFQMVDEDHNGRLNDFGLLYGTNFGKAVQCYISGGIGVFNGYDLVTIYNGTTIPPTYSDKKYSTFNVPLEIGVSFAPEKSVGLGIAGFASLNSRISVFGITLKLELGKRR